MLPDARSNRPPRLRLLRQLRKRPLLPISIGCTRTDEPGVCGVAHRLLLHAWLIACCMRQWARRFSDFNVRILATLNPAQSPPLTGLVAPCPLYGVLQPWALYSPARRLPADTARPVAQCRRTGAGQGELPPYWMHFGSASVGSPRYCPAWSGPVDLAALGHSPRVSA